MRKWYSKSAGVCGCLLLALLAGCEGKSGGEGNGESAKKVSKDTIGVSMMTLSNPFFKVIADNIEREASPHGYDVILLSADENAAKQDDQVKDFIAKDVAAIVLAPYDSKAIATSIAAAEQAGIPVFTVDNACLDESAKVIAHVGTDNYEGGRQAGQVMVQQLAETGGKVAILDHKVTESCLARVKGFKEVIDEHNASSQNKIEIAVELPSGGNRQTGHASTQDILQTHGDIAGIFAINDPSALGAYAALVEAGKQDDIFIIGFDGQPQGKEAIRDGKILADPIQFPDRMGQKIVALMLDHFNGERVEPLHLIPTEIYDRDDALNDPELSPKQ